MALSIKGVFQMIEELPVFGCGEVLSTVGDSGAAGSFGSLIPRHGCGGCECLGKRGLLADFYEEMWRVLRDKMTLYSLLLFQFKIVRLQLMWLF